MTADRAVALIRELDHLHPDTLDRKAPQQRALYRKAIDTAEQHHLIRPRHATALRLALRP